jgi:hypothetical protein
VRSRVLDHLWAGLPSLLSDGDQAAAMAREHGVGRVATPEDVTEVAQALTALLSDGGLRVGMAARARALAPRFAWPGLVRPITEFLAAAPAATERHRTSMDTPQSEAQPVFEDVAQVQRGRLMHATRNAAIQAINHTWSLERLAAPPGGRLSGLRRLIRERLLWPLLHPLIARQQDQNAAVLRALYAIAEHSDDQKATLGQAQQRIQSLAELIQRLQAERNMLAQQLCDMAEQLAGLEDADIQTRALLRGDPPPPPASAPREAE